MDIHKVICLIDQVFNLRAGLMLMPPAGLPRHEIRDMKFTLRRLEVILIRKHEESLREELATEIREMRTLSVTERALNYFASPRYSVAILLVRAEL